MISLILSHGKLSTGSDEDIAIRLFREYTGRATTYDDVYIMKQDVPFQPVHYDADKNYYDMNQGCLIINNLVKWTLFMVL